jgi:hypothetical protein
VSAYAIPNSAGTDKFIGTDGPRRIRQNEKKGPMQELLTGEVRVKLPKGVA